MRKILVLGAGKIGSLVARLFIRLSYYQVWLVDVRPPTAAEAAMPASLTYLSLDITDVDKLRELIQQEKIDAIVSCLPFFHNLTVAHLARALGTHYFDLTEDIYVSKAIEQLAQGATTAFVPRCGLAPGLVNIIAADMIHRFDRVEEVLICAGALPAHPHNALKYALSWSTEGLINQYINPCMGLVGGKTVSLIPLEGYQTIIIDGLRYEAFNTSGGVGTLTTTFSDTVNTLQYKTLRYPGHCEKMRFLLNDLHLKDNREILKQILEKAIPSTVQDVVVIYVGVKGYSNEQLWEENYVKKLYPQIIAEQHYTAIQLSTASAVCAVADIVMESSKKYKGMVLQESFSLQAILNNPYGQYYG